MTIEKMQADKLVAMKNKDIVTKSALSNMIDMCQKATITNKGRIEITEQLVDEVLIKYQKTIQEMIDTCPIERADLLEKYKAEMEIVKQYVPQLMTNPDEIKAIIFTITSQNNIDLIKQNKGMIMKTITPYFKGKADMKIVSQVANEVIV